MFGIEEKQDEPAKPKFEGMSRCPGESNCHLFAGAASENGGDGLAACADCPLLPTKHKDISAGRCPGESKCSDFLSARGSDRKAKESNACTACPKFWSKPKQTADKNAPHDPDKPEAETGDKITAFIRRVKWLKSELEVSGNLNYYRITESDYQSLVYFNLCCERYERESRVGARRTLEQYAEMTAGLIKALAMR